MNFQCVDLPINEGARFNLVELGELSSSLQSDKLSSEIPFLHNVEDKCPHLSFFLPCGLKMYTQSQRRYSAEKKSQRR